MQELDPEHSRLVDRSRRRQWRRWGPYLGERQWGTVREDYSAQGDAWNFVGYEQARSYAYRWGEDGIAGLCDYRQRLCFAVAFWNGRDPFLKERLFGLTNPEGNHGEDVKEYYWHRHSSPTHSYMDYLYRYPQRAFPYQQLRREASRRTPSDREFELIDTGVFDQDAFFDVDVEYAKVDFDDVLIRITVRNHGRREAPLWLLPTLWFRNDWSWKPNTPEPLLERAGTNRVRALHPGLGQVSLDFDAPSELLFTHNETNTERLYGHPNRRSHVKDGFNQYLVEGDTDAVSPREGTKFAPLYRLTLAPGASHTLRLRLCESEQPRHLSASEQDGLFSRRRQEMHAFFGRFVPKGCSAETRRLQEGAFSGLLWSKQWYHYDVTQWLEGDPTMPPPPVQRREGRNSRWVHLHNDEILLMPDTWEYPWYAVWDSAFHAVALSLLDPSQAKRQLDRFTREWYMHPNGQLPAYEWSLDDVNPPVHAWAAYRTYKIEAKHWGNRDLGFLERIFHKLLMNFTWWVNRKDARGRNLFQGGFLGMDNIGVFDRNTSLPDRQLLQSDGTSWMAMYALNMLRIAFELAVSNSAYEDIASKFYEHFLAIATAINTDSWQSPSLWDEEDGFYYDHLRSDAGVEPLRIRSLVGLVPLLAVEILDIDTMERFQGFTRRKEWFDQNRSDLTGNISCRINRQRSRKCLLSLLKPDRMRRVLGYLLDEEEFLSPFGIRSLSRFHLDNPFFLEGIDDPVRYEPGESASPLFGGNSNWRGPIWFPMNFLLIEALRKYAYYWGDDFKVEFPTRSGNEATLDQVADGLSRRLISLFQRHSGHRPCNGPDARLQTDPLWKDHLLFHEYFHAETGEGLGASHQTGWTALVAKLIFQSGGG